MFALRLAILAGLTCLLAACRGLAEPGPSAGLQDTQACRPQRQQPLGLGFPIAADRLPAIGPLHAAVLFADFEDAPAERSPAEALAIVSPGAEEFFAELSGGRLQVQLHPQLIWLRLSQPQAHYAAGLTSFEAHLDFLQEAVDLADAAVDFSQMDLVLVLTNPDATGIPYGPAFTGFADHGIQADGVTIANGITSGSDLLHWGHLWLNHEMGHSLGLPDLYAYPGAAAAEADQFAFTGEFSLMGNIFGQAPELTAIERWMLGWLEDEQVLCLSNPGQWEITLTALEQQDAQTKAIMLPLADGQMLVIEARRPLGYDWRLQQPGALVYLVDTHRDSGYGPLRVLAPEGKLPGQAALQAGESLQYEGVSVQVLESGAEFDRLWVSFGLPD
ncbi:MAG: hypothetical protein KIT46_03050 [Anaerolineales bacterium]|nr:hypothetical protein [Anaerolineales bacterium]MCW5855003.1 hypothetical protein [Anaerolineales bacterium]